MRWLIGVAGLALLANAVAAGHPPTMDLCAEPPGALFEVVNGEVSEADGQVAVLRWAVKTGQTSHLQVRREHPLAMRLRYYDRLDFEFRVASGELSQMDVRALGHVSGVFQYKAHEWHVANRTTERGVWHSRQLDLSRPAWYPWDNPDGEGGEYFRFQALGIAPGTVVELRNVRLSRHVLVLKPDYELPVTWPVATNNADGSVAYSILYGVLNAAGRPVTAVGRVASAHERFALQLVAPGAEEGGIEARADLKNGKTALFTLRATMSVADIRATPELYEEPLRLEFSPADAAEAVCRWSGVLVRPFSPTTRRQVVVPAAELEHVRRAVAEGDQVVLDLVNWRKIKDGADAFLAKELLHIPTAHQHPGSFYQGKWRPAERMPEAVNLETGEKEFGTDRADHTWKMYFGYPGYALEHLGLAYLYSGDEKYAAKAVELFRLYAQQYPELLWGPLFGGVPWHRAPVLLAASRMARSSTYGSNWYFKSHCRLLSMIADSPSWTDADRRAVYERFVVPYATEIMKFPGGINNMTDITNHNLLLLGLAFRDAHLVRWATKTDPGVISRLRDIDGDGFSSEGRPLNYHFAGMSEYLPAIAYLGNSGLDVAFPKDKLLAALRMPFYRSTLDGRVPSSGDCGRGGGVRRNPLADYLLPLFPDEDWLYDLGASPLRLHLAGRKDDPQAWRTLIDTRPHLFREAGMAVLRHGETVETQVMATLDYGRNVMHAALDRNQLTLAAFGKTFTHGPGSLYNAGSGGIVRSTDARLNAFVGHGSLSQNVVMVDRLDQLPAIGELLAWSDEPGFQVAVSRVGGIRPGVAHTRGLVLTRGLVIVLDRIESDAEHLYDFVYHNFGTLTPGPGWTAAPAEAPLGDTANYGNIIEPRRLTGSGLLALEWVLTGQIREHERLQLEKQGQPPPTVGLRLWHAAPAGAEFYTGTTGLNNPNTGNMPEAAPSLFSRVRAREARFATVLEPHRGESTVTAVTAAEGNGITISLAGGDSVTIALEALLDRHAVRD